MTNEQKLHAADRLEELAERLLDRAERIRNEVYARDTVPCPALDGPYYLAGSADDPEVWV